MAVVAELDPQSASALAAEDDVVLNFAEATDEEIEYDQPPFPGGMTLCQKEWTSFERDAKDGNGKETIAKEQLHIAVMPDTFEVHGIGFHSYYDIPPFGEPDADGVRHRAKPRANSKFGRFLKGLDILGGDPATERPDDEGNVVRDPYTINRLASMIADSDDGVGLRATWKRERMDFGRRGEKQFRSKPTLVVVGPHPDDTGLTPAREFGAEDRELAASVYVGRTDREVQAEVGNLGLPPHVYTAVLSGSARKALIEDGVIVKNRETKAYEQRSAAA